MWNVSRRPARNRRAATAGSEPITRALVRISVGVLVGLMPSPPVAADLVVTGGVTGGVVAEAGTAAAAGRSRVAEASSAAPQYRRGFMDEES